MPTPERPNGQELNLVTALQTIFSQDADPEMFLARAADKISELERTIISACSRNRIRIDDNLYTLLESRDAIAEQEQDIESAVSTASEITGSIEAAVAALTEKMHVRQNLDAALVVAAQTRKLTRMYARIEDTIDARRLYTAFRMLQVLEEETRAIKPGTVLRELVPDCQQLRATITLHARKALHSWLATIPHFEEELGGYALYDANKQSGNADSLATLSRVHARGEPPARARRTGSGMNASGHTAAVAPGIRDRDKAWSPLLTSSAGQAGGLSRGLTRGSFTSQRTSIREEASTNAGIASTPTAQASTVQESPAPRWFATDRWSEAPKIYLRALLQSLQVHQGLELLDELRGEYVKERQAHLKRAVDEVMETWVDRGEGVTSLGLARMRRMEDCVVRVCGVFVVERGVERYAEACVLQRAVVDEWWGVACARVNGILREVEAGGEADAMWADALSKAVEAFATAQAPAGAPIR